MDRNYSSIEWDTGERSGLNRIKDSVEKLITLPLNGSDQGDGNFDLYYFVHTAKGDLTSKSVLFCAGGPGQIVRTLDRADTYVDFLSKNGYNVVCFHLRGTGFSQIPARNDNDKFLRSEFAIADMEAIRQDFLDKGFGSRDMQWEAIVGWSFGTVLAQLYAERKSKLVKKLILISPLSRHMFKNSKCAYDDYYRTMLVIYRQTLDRIFSSNKEQLYNEFGDLTATDKEKILDQLFKVDDDGILQKTEQAFGSIQSLIDAYSDIDEGEFERFRLRKFSRRFYQSLRDLRVCGANAIDDSGIIEKQRLIGKTLRDELLPKRVPIVNEPVRNEYNQGSQRAYYCFGIQDGLNWIFLREHYDRGKSVQDSLNAIAGESGSQKNSQSFDRSLKKVKIDQTSQVTPWDPADHPHSIPTLILNGELDPITAGGQAERYFESGLTGPRTLIVFPSIGHAISLGAIFTTYDDQPPILSGGIRLALPSISPGEVVETKGSATGVELNRNLRIDLDKPEELKNRIKIHGCGILKDVNVEKTDEGDDHHVVALIENLSDGEIKLQNYNWLLRTPLIWGIVDFVEPKAIAAKATCALFGRLVHGQRNQNNRYQIRPLLPEKLEPGLKLVGFNLKEGSSVELWLQNESERFIDAPIVSQWTIQNVDVRLPFRVDVPKLERHEVKSLSVGVDGLNLDASEVLAINPPEGLANKLTACFDNQAENSDRLSFIVWNKDKETKAHRIDKPWNIRCPVFEATVVLDPLEIEPNTLKRVAGDVKGITWVKCLEVEPPYGWNSKLRLLSFNILEQNSISMLFKNTGDRALDSPLRDWKYVVPSVNPNETDLDRALNCLIFSFLVLDPSQFRIREDNEALKRIEDRFKKLSLDLKILPDPGDVVRF
jgi:pimeloyl-ACP methyl ester carboxylesterase